MGNQNRRHVVRNADKGGWDIRAPGSQRSSGHARTQREAQDRAREIVSRAGGGEVVTYGRDGKIRGSNTVPPGNDPFPPRDRAVRHPWYAG